MGLNDTMKTKLHEILQKKIIEGEYEDGKQLVETELAEEYNVSRSPIREAIRELVSDGLAYSIPHKGVFVKTINEKKMRDIYELRILLENYCIRKITGKLSVAEIEKLEYIKSKLYEHRNEKDTHNYIIYDEMLHNYIINLGGNDVIKETYQKNTFLIKSFIYYALNSQNRYKESFEEHSTIIDGLLNDAPDKSCSMNQLHLEKSLELILKKIKKPES